MAAFFKPVVSMLAVGLALAVAWSATDSTLALPVAVGSMVLIWGVLIWGVLTWPSGLDEAWEPAAALLTATVLVDCGAGSSPPEQAARVSGASTARASRLVRAAFTITPRVRWHEA